MIVRRAAGFTLASQLGVRWTLLIIGAGVLARFAGGCSESRATSPNAPGIMLAAAKSNELQMGDTGRLVLQLGIANSSSPVTWTSSDTTVLVLAADGELRAVGDGSPVITAQWGDTSVSRSFLVRPAILVGAGDIARCDNIANGSGRTAAMLDTIRGRVFTAGDNVYETGTAEEWRQCFKPTWGRHKARIRPAMGNTTRTPTKEFRTTPIGERLRAQPD